MLLRHLPCAVICLWLAAASGRAAAQAGDPPDSPPQRAAGTGTGMRAPYPVIRVPPVTGAVVAPPPRSTSPAPLPAPLAVPRAAVITQCDPTGCWDSSGRRLNRVGPGLAGPGGQCTVQGHSALCP